MPGDGRERAFQEEGAVCAKAPWQERALLIQRIEEGQCGWGVERGVEAGLGHIGLGTQFVYIPIPMNSH